MLIVIIESPTEEESKIQYSNDEVDSGSAVKLLLLLLLLLTAH